MESVQSAFFVGGLQRALYDSRNNKVFASDAEDGFGALDGVENSQHGNTEIMTYDGACQIEHAQ